MGSATIVRTYAVHESESCMQLWRVCVHAGVCGLLRIGGCVDDRCTGVVDVNATSVVMLPGTVCAITPS